MKKHGNDFFVKLKNNMAIDWLMNLLNILYNS